MICRLIFPIIVSSIDKFIIEELKPFVPRKTKKNILVFVNKVGIVELKNDFSKLLFLKMLELICNMLS